MKITHMLAIAALAALFSRELRVAGIGTGGCRAGRGDPQMRQRGAGPLPNVGQKHTMRARTDVYRSCMAAAGQRP